MRAFPSLFLAWLVSLPLTAAELSAPSLIISHSDQILDVEPPAYASQASAVRVTALGPERMQTGEPFLLVLPDGGRIELQFEEVSTLVNGDRVVRAGGRQAGDLDTLVLTLGERSLLGRVDTGDGAWQLIAWPDATGYLGWLFKPLGLGEGIDMPSDVVRLGPRHERAPMLGETLTLSAVGATDQPDVQVLEQLSGLSITQQFSRRAVRVDETVEVLLGFENFDPFWRYNLVVDVYFVLEDGEVVAAPPNCWETLSLSLQPILRCTLGSLAPGASKSVAYTVLASEASKPYILNTAIVGEFRSDAYIAVVDDVRTDSDGDGISDFNEALLGTDPYDAESVDHSNVTIDVVTFYTPDAQALYPWSIETRINQLISVANQVYADSGVGIRLRPVYHGLVDYDGGVDMDTALGAIVEASHPAFEDTHALRTRYGGDLAILFKPRGEEMRCGLANLGGYSTEGSFDPTLERDYAYSTIAIDCSLDLVVAHELGHNMGLTHSHLEDGHGGTFDFSTGYGVQSEFVTVMAYPGAFSAEVKIPRFSDPAADCLGFPCGRPDDQPFAADAVQSLNLVRHQIAAYYPQQVPDLPQKPTVTLSGSETSASISMAASTDEGLSYTGLLSAEEVVDISIDVRVDDEHVGQDARFHVVVTPGADAFFELSASGQFLPWDGDVNSLLGFGDPLQLRTRHNIKLINDFRVDASLAGVRLWIYFAYRVIEDGELVFTAEPMALQFLPADE